MFPDDRSAGRSAGHFILWEPHSTRDHLSLAAGKSGSTPSRDCHVRDQVPADGEGGRLVAFKLREASACRAPGNDCRHESIYAAPSFSRPYGDESAAISKAASPACRTATHTHGWTGRGKCGVRGRLRKPEPIQSRVQAILWPAPNSRYQGHARRQSRGEAQRQRSVKRASLISTDKRACILGTHSIRARRCLIGAARRPPPKIPGPTVPS